jgi:hypothetical protein
MIYLIAYKIPFDFFVSSADELEKDIQSYPGWCKCYDSAFLIATTETIDAVSAKLTRHFKENDCWLLIDIGSRVCGSLPQAVWDWVSDTRSKGY